MMLPQSPDTELSPNETEQIEYPFEGSTTRSLSASRADIVAALAKAQGAFPEVIKDKVVRVKPRSGGQEYEFRYATLGAIIKAIKKPLSDNGIAYTQTLSFDITDRLYYLETSLWWGDQTISSVTPLIIGDNQGNQPFGSALSYMRRYSLAASQVGPPNEGDAANDR